HGDRLRVVQRRRVQRARPVRPFPPALADGCVPEHTGGSPTTEMPMARPNTGGERRSAAGLFARRTPPGRALAQDAGRVATACHAMAVRLHRGGKVLVFGTGAAATDAQHIAVEFVHPVIVGKRALPATSLTNDVATVTGLATERG